MKSIKVHCVRVTEYLHPALLEFWAEWLTGKGISIRFHFNENDECAVFREFMYGDGTYQRDKHYPGEEGLVGRRMWKSKAGIR